MTEILFVITKLSISASKVEKVSVIHPRKVAVSASRVYIKPLGEVKSAQVVSPVKVELIAFKLPLTIWFAVKVFDEFNFTVWFTAVCNSSIFVPTLVVPYNN